MTPLDITFCIFSFNRAQFLRNCVASIQASAPQADIYIFDDDSDDLETCQYLQQVEQECHIVKPREVGWIKHGGLYLNMQMALEKLADRPLVCFLQDDTQLVRPVGKAEIDEMRKLFDDNPRLGFVHPCFVRGIDLLKRPVNPQSGPNQRTFYRADSGQSAGVYYSDLLLAVPRRLLHKGWQFRQSEPDNDRQARQMFDPMLYLYDPFAMWLPEVPAYRGKRKTLALKLAEAKKNCGYFPFRIWSEQASQQFVTRQNPEVPVAEEFLTCEPAPSRKPWTYNPLTGLRWLKRLNAIEVFFSKLKRKFNS